MPPTSNDPVLLALTNLSAQVGGVGQRVGELSAKVDAVGAAQSGTGRDLAVFAERLGSHVADHSRALGEAAEWRKGVDQALLELRAQMNSWRGWAGAGFLLVTAGGVLLRFLFH
jgi:hypothetical protein